MPLAGCSPWARQAGFGDIEYTTSTWTFSTAPDLAWWCGLWAERMTMSRLAEQAIAYDISDSDELSAIAAAWRGWGGRDDAVFIVPHGEIVATAWA